MEAAPGFFVMIFTTPPIAPVPYIVLPDPRTISTWSMLSVGIWARSTDRPGSS